MSFISRVKKSRYFIFFSLLCWITTGLWFTQYLNLDLSLSSRFLNDEAQLSAYTEFRREFGPEPLLSVVWEVPGQVFDERNLQRLGELTETLRHSDQVDSVISITSIIRKNENSILSKKKVLLSLPLSKKLLLGPKGKTTVVLIFPTTESLSPSLGGRLVKSVEKTINEFLIDGEKGFVTGPLAMQSKAIEYSRRDLLTAGFCVLSLILCLFALSFKTWRAVTAALLITASSILGACGVLAFFQVKVSQFALMAFPILAVISIQDAVHLLESFMCARKRGVNKADACGEMILSCWTPCFWTTVTTVAAFGTLFFSQVEQIRSVGIVVLIGAPIALAVSFLIVPALLLHAPEAREKSKKAKRGTSLAVNIWVARLSEHSSTITIILLLMTLFSAMGIHLINIRFDFPRIFSKGVSLTRQLEVVDNTLSGAASFEVVLKTTDGTTFLDEGKFKLIQGFQQAMSLTGPVGETISPVDIALTVYILKAGLPESVEKVLNNRRDLLKMIKDQDGLPLKDWVSDDLARVRIHVRLLTNKQEQYDSMMEALKNLKQSLATVGVDVSWSGLSLLYKEMEKKMLNELIRSFLQAYLVITLMMMVLFRSFLWGALTMIPNLLPICVTLGIMGWAGVDFSLGLIILPAVGLGFIVDDTIHMLWNLRRFRLRGDSSQEAITKVFSTTGRALVLTSTILVCGFASLLTSHFQSNVQLGLLMPLLLILALIFDLVGVPAILLWVEKKDKRGIHRPTV